MSDVSKYIKKSNIKCPICQTLLDMSIMSDKVLGCPKCRNMGNIDLWQELIRTRKMLKIAIGAIETIKYSKKSDAINLRHKANKALIDIYKIKDQTALEQKDKQCGGN